MSTLDSHPIDDRVRSEIMRRLRAAEQEHDIKVLYACESGSRAWGFASPDSDYDVRFIYVHQRDWYLSYQVERKRDVIEYPIVDEIDCGGWDLRKALYLFTRTNGALLEWLKSPIQYIEHGETAAALRRLEGTGINLTALCYHYSHMARNNAREHLQRPQVKLKKYFYVLRPLLAIRYIVAKQAAPPIEFQALVDAVAPPELLEPIATLLEIKRHQPEQGLGPPVEMINRFVARELASHGEQFSGFGRPESKQQALSNALDTIFLQAVNHSVANATPFTA